MKFETHLVSGAGNTFHIAYIDSSKAEALEFFNLTKNQKKSIAKNICETNKADGFIFLKKSSQNGPMFGSKFSWDFYNNDGSDAEMCGNATRCVGFFVKNILLSPETQWFLNTTAGEIKIESFGADKFKVQMTAIKVLESKLGFYCDTGVPHLVLEISEFENYKSLKTKAQALRNHSDFQPKGTNVTYVKLLENTSDRSISNKVRAVSFERGVENFTEACGTGAMAAAMYNLMKRGSYQTEVEMPGGTLIMDLSKLNAPQMIGPANLLGKYAYDSSKI